jgi:membrane protease YdiL (CAAX protease family)
MGGVILGLVYVKSGRNLMSVILLHAMVDWVPGTIMVSQVKFGGG